MVKRYQHLSDKRKARVRIKITQSRTDVKLVVTRSNKYTYAQLVNLKTGKTIGGAKDKLPQNVGTEIAKIAKTAKIKQAVLDRGNFKYHGQIKLLTEAARKEGLII